jgi:hypothetical protein
LAFLFPLDAFGFAIEAASTLTSSSGDTGVGVGVGIGADTTEASRAFWALEVVDDFFLLAGFN